MPRTAQPQDESPEDPAWLRKKLGALEKALRIIDVSACDEIINELQKRQWSPAIQKALEDIYQNILLFEFEEAIQIIGGVMDEFKSQYYKAK